MIAASLPQSQSGKRAMHYLLCCSMCFLQAISLGQDALASEPLKVPEKEMASRLLVVVPPKNSVEWRTKCSNRMVMLDVVIAEDGHVSSAKLTSGFEEFRESSVAAVKQWTYKPFLQNGSATTVETTVSIIYLGDGTAGPFLSPDGKGGVKGGDTLPLPPGCGPAIMIKKAP